MLKFILRLIKHLFMLFAMSLPLQVVGMLLIGIYLPIHRQIIKNNPSRGLKLPYCLRWFDNADIYLGRDTSVYTAVANGSLWNHWWWLAVRNPCNYFGYVVLGFLPRINITRRYYSATYYVEDLHLNDRLTREVGDNGGKFPGFMIQEYEIDGIIRYEYYLIYKWDAAHCFRFRMGYKLGNSRQQDVGKWVQAVIVLQPWKSYSGM